LTGDIILAQSTLTKSDIENRITFHENSQIMEVSFAGMALESSEDVNLFYDIIEESIAKTGEEMWFFLVDYRDTKIDNDAWFSFSRRGMDLNKAHSMGSVRFDASEITRKQIERDAGTEAFDPNLFYDRESALERLRSLPSTRREKLVHVPSFTADDLKWCIEFNPDEQIMYVNFSNMSFEHSRDVNDVYDFIEDQIRQTGKKWYFVINYENTRIQSPAWVQYAARGKKLNQESSLGSVRYAPGSETETDIRLRAESQGFRPNIRNSLEEAMELIGEMKEAASEQA
jgi:hypothetical protein